VDNGVEEAFFEQELGTLKAFGEFLADGSLDHARTGTAAFDACPGTQRLRLAAVE
jgi:hypothetical protein